MYFPELNLHGRERVRVNFRGLFTTNSAAVAFCSEHLREEYPLCLYGGDTLLEEGSQWVFPFELDGYLLISRDAKYNIYEAGPYEKFEIQPGLITTVQAFVPFISTITGISNPSGVITLNYYDGRSELRALDADINYTQENGSEGTKSYYSGTAFSLDKPQYQVGGVYDTANFAGFSGTPYNPPAVFPTIIASGVAKRFNAQDPLYVEHFTARYYDGSPVLRGQRFSCPPNITVAYLQNIFRVGAAWLGPNGYAPFTPIDGG